MRIFAVKSVVHYHLTLNYQGKYRFVAKNRNSQTSQTIVRITGFDPAYPMYYGTSSHVALNRNDAKFVDIIHTDQGIIGAPISSGHAGLD